jgi:hypothetical protein
MENRADALVAAAELEQAGQLAEAEQAYRELVRTRPGDADTHHRLAIVLARRGQFSEAGRYFRRAVQLKPDDLNVRNDYGYALCLEGKLDEAEQVLREALELAPGHATVQANLDLVHQKQGRGGAVDDEGDSVTALPVPDEAVIAAVSEPTEPRRLAADPQTAAYPSTGLAPYRPARASGARSSGQGAAQPIRLVMDAEDAGEDDDRPAALGTGRPESLPREQVAANPLRQGRWLGAPTENRLRARHAAPAEGIPAEEPYEELPQEDDLVPTEPAEEFAAEPADPTPPADEPQTMRIAEPFVLQPVPEADEATSPEEPAPLVAADELPEDELTAESTGEPPPPASAQEHAFDEAPAAPYDEEAHSESAAPPRYATRAPAVGAASNPLRSTARPMAEAPVADEARAESPEPATPESVETDSTPAAAEPSEVDRYAARRRRYQKAMAPETATPEEMSPADRGSSRPRETEDVAVRPNPPAPIEDVAASPTDEPRRPVPHVAARPRRTPPQGAQSAPTTTTARRTPTTTGTPRAEPQAEAPSSRATPPATVPRAGTQPDGSVADRLRRWRGTRPRTTDSEASGTDR